MNITILGTGMVGRALATRISELHHDVVIGTRDPAATRARTEPDAMGTPPFSQWATEHPAVRLMTLPNAGDHGELVINATSGVASLAALETVGAERLAHKVLLDLAVPFDFSRGMPPTPTIPNTDSIAERIQQAFPKTRVVKSLNTVFCNVMVDPARVPGDHTLFVSGDDVEAKSAVRALLEELGWGSNVIDLGGIETARNVEMYMLLYFNLAEVLGTFDFNITIAES